MNRDLKAITKKFFAAYDAHDVDSMLTLCAEGAQAKIGKLVEPKEIDVPTAQVAVVLSSLLKGVCVITITAKSVAGEKTDLEIHGYSKHNLAVNASRKGVDQVIRELGSRFR